MAAKNRGGVIVGAILGTVAVAGVGIGLVVALSGDDGDGDGKTGPIPDLMNTDARERMADMVCACMDAGARGTNEIAACCLRRVYAQADVSWPPPPNADPSHKRAWDTMNEWLGEVENRSNLAGQTMCEWLRAAGAPGPVIIDPLPTEPVDTPTGPTVTPTTPTNVIWDPEQEPGFVAGATFCGDNVRKPYNAAVFDDDGDEVIAELEAQGYPLVRLQTNAQTLTEAGPVIERYQRDSNAINAWREIGDDPLAVDGKMGGCTLRVLSYRRAMRLAGDNWPPAAPTAPTG